MKLLLDQGLPRSAATFLTSEGIDAVHVFDIGYGMAEDSEIILKAGEEGRTIATLDSDFHALIALTGETFPSVIRIRIQGLNGAAISNILRTIVKDYSEYLLQGALLTVQDEKVRMRRLPIIPKQAQ